VFRRAPRPDPIAAFSVKVGPAPDCFDLFICCVIRKEVFYDPSLYQDRKSGPTTRKFAVSAASRDAQFCPSRIWKLVGSFAGPAHFFGCLRSRGLPFPPVRAVKVGGCRHRFCILGFGFLVRDPVATGQHAPVDRRGGGLDPRHTGRIPDGPGSGANIDPRRLALIPGCGPAPGDDLHRPGDRRKQG